MDLKRGGPEGETVTEFKWKRHRLFEFESAFILYEMVLEDPIAHVVKVAQKEKRKLYASDCQDLREHP